MMSSSESEDNLGITESKGVRIPLPWEILQPLLRIIGHCLLGPFNTQDAKDAASVAVRRLYARASHDLVPQAILATRSPIHLDKRTREAAKAAAANTSSNANTPSKAKKHEILLYCSFDIIVSNNAGNRGRSRIPFRWSSRISVALGISRALEYLHHNCNSQGIVPHGNLRSTNVLLDLNEKVSISDYGLSSIIAQPIAAQRLLSYKSPEHQTTRRISKKSDVWSYGSLLLELLTARISACLAPPGTGKRSASSGMLEQLQVAIRCCDKSPENRREMTEVVREVESIKALVESEDEEDLSMEQSLTDESL
ncbi:hypothetical protein SADUNF_Sadunf03G0012900 [Salix dunnii]|uniref:Protein kinase domain-containing protein n=1 Tax=Salix dunnii TaxID=1413687 RepID=A0A835N1F2_9ROSI|nr:hypothetical protein SADUNF_Sadunf03G0012900 [Salix dunnii]